MNTSVSQQPTASNLYMTVRSKQRFTYNTDSNVLKRSHKV